MEIKRLLFVLVLTGVLVAVTISFILGVDEIIALLNKANLLYLALAVLLQFLGIAFLTERWKIFTDKAGVKISFFKIYQIMLAGISISNITPSARVGGEPLRAYLLNKHGNCRTGKSLSTVVIERIFDAATFAMISLVVLGSAMVVLPLWISSLLFIAFAFNAFFLFVMLYLSLEKKAGMGLVNKLISFFSRFSRRLRKKSVQKQILSGVEDYIYNARYLLREKRLWLYALVLSFMVWLADSFRMFFVFRALGANVSLYVIFTVLVITALVGFLPLIPGGLALIESSMIIIYVLSGMNTALAGAQTILDRFISYWLVTFTGLFCAYRLGLKRKKKFDIDIK